MTDCRNYALKLITFRDRTEKELRDKLREKGYDENTIEDEIVFLKDYGYIDDGRYAKSFTNDAISIKKWGRIRVYNELLKRGIDRETIAAALEDAFQDDSTDAVTAVLESRFKEADLGNPRERTRIFNYFMRRGYAPEEIKGAMNRVCAFNDID